VRNNPQEDRTDMNRLNSYTILLVGCYYILYTNFSFLVAHYMKTAPPLCQNQLQGAAGLASHRADERLARGEGLLFLPLHGAKEDGPLEGLGRSSWDWFRGVK